MQEDIEKLFQWEKQANMKFNIGKFKWLQFGKNKNIVQSYNYLSPDFTDIMVQSDEAQDLDIIMNCDANFNNHINQVSLKMNKKLDGYSEGFNVGNHSL